MFKNFTLLLLFVSLVYPESKKGVRLVESISKKHLISNLQSTSQSIVQPKKKLVEEPIKKIATPQVAKELFNFERVFESKDFVVKVRSRSFKQGELMMVRLFDSNGKTSSTDLLKYSVRWQNKEIKLIKLNDILSGFIPIPPEFKIGTYDLEIRTRDEANTYKACPMEIAKADFIEKKVTETLKLPKRFSNKGNDKTDYEFIAQCEKLKREAFESNTQISFANNFQLPAKMKKITSNFYARRNYFNKKGKPHGGIDIRGNTGDPIYAIQDGKVLIARKMYFEGIFTVIDHGNKIFSMYMHQSETLVNEGDTVKKGQHIGKIGSTGMSTGPHLHLGLKVEGVLLNPLSAIQLKIF
jgi:murein DD-endopeptidase MepM/ murein hydrolase activator NlpD